MEYKDTFEIVREREKALRREGAWTLLTQLHGKLAQMHPDTEMTVGMFTKLIEGEQEKWILNLEQNAGKTAGQY